jgi:hypothetical protein
MRLSRILAAVVLVVGSFSMAHAVDAGLTHHWPAWSRALWVSGILGSLLGGIYLALNGFGLLTEILSPSVPASDGKAKLTVGTFVVVYLGTLVAAIALALALEALAGIPGRRTGLVFCGAVFLLAATGRPWWLYTTVRRVRWFALIESDRAMRILLAVVGSAVILAGIAMKSTAES